MWTYHWSQYLVLPYKLQQISFCLQRACKCSRRSVSCSFIRLVSANFIFLPLHNIKLEIYRVTVLFIEDKSSKVDEQAEGGAKKESVRSLLTTPSFIRFMIFSILMTNVRSMFRHLDATLPKYLIRQHGPGVVKGLIYSINPISIIIFVPIFQLIVIVMTLLDLYRNTLEYSTR